MADTIGTVIFAVFYLIVIAELACNCFVVLKDKCVGSYNKCVECCNNIFASDDIQNQIQVQEQNIDLLAEEHKQDNI